MTAATAAEMRRPAGDRILLGVCPAIAHRLDLDVTLVRIVAAIGLVLLPAAFIVAYAAFALVVPRDDGRMLIGGSPSDRRESVLGWLLVAAAATVVVATPPLFGFGDFDVFEVGILIVALSLVGLAMSRSYESRGEAAAVSASAYVHPADPDAATEPLIGTETEGEHQDVDPTEVHAGQGPGPGHGSSPRRRRERRPGPSVFIPTFAALTAAVGLAAVVAAVFDLSVTPVSVAVVTGSMAVACGGVALAAMDRRGAIPLLLLGSVLAVVAATAAIGRDEFDRGVGYREVQPLTAEQLESGYEIGVGYIEVDLRNVELPPGTTTMPLHVGYGAAGVIVPPDLVVTSAGDSIKGELPVGTEVEQSGGGAATGDSGKKGGRAVLPPVLEIDADVTAGAVEIDRGGGRGSG